MRGKADEFPGGAVAEQARDQSGVHGVAGALGDDAALDAAAGEGEVADEVEDLVADELVGEAQGAVLHGRLWMRMMAQCGQAPRMRPMSRSLASSSLKPKVRAGAMTVGVGRRLRGRRGRFAGGRWAAGKSME